MKKLAMFLAAVLALTALVTALPADPVTAQDKSSLQEPLVDRLAGVAKRFKPSDIKAAAERQAAALEAARQNATAPAAGGREALMGFPMGPGAVPDYYTTPNWANSPALPKFVDPLPGLYDPRSGVPAPAKCIPLAVPDTNTFPGSDYYEIELQEYTEVMHSAMPATRLRGYVQVNPGTDDIPGSPTLGQNVIQPGPIRYLGPLIVAQRNRPVRVKFSNKLPFGPFDPATGRRPGDLFIPVDGTVMGSGDFMIDYDPETLATTPMTMGTFTQNRGTLHLHGGRSPWISDGTAHQWITPAGETTTYPRGVSVKNVPDMWFDAAGVPIASCSGQLTCAVPGASNSPGPGTLTFFWTNQQSSRMMFYHDHAWGITRLNVYAGEAAGYLITDTAEQGLVNAGLIPPATAQIPLIIQDKTFVNPATIVSTDPTWAWGTQPWNGTPGAAMTPVLGDLWWPHVYMPAQNPYNPDLSGINPMGRWMYGPWFWPPTPLCFDKGGTDPLAVKPYCVSVATLPNPYYDCWAAGEPNLNAPGTTYPGAGPCTNPLQPPEIPGTPTVSWGAEAFLDTMVVNGQVYPTVTLAPQQYRFRVLNAAHDRFLNLQFYRAVPIISGITVTGGGSGYTSNPVVTITGDGTGATAQAIVDLTVGSPTFGQVTGIDLLTVGSGYTAAATTVTITGGGALTNATATANIYAPLTEVGMVPAAATTGFPTLWPTDGREGGVPDPATAGPAFIQIATEGGFLPAPVLLPNQPIQWNQDPTMFNFGNILPQPQGGGTFILGPAERGDVIVDFTNYAGQTLILYNDAPAAYPALDPHYDYYTNAPDRTMMGGYGPIPPGVGPNVRTVMQVVVSGTPGPTAPPVNDYNPTTLANLQAAFRSTGSVAGGTFVPGVFAASQEPIVVGQAAYDSTYNALFPATWPNWGLSRISDTSLAFETVNPNGSVSAPTSLAMMPKAMHDEMGGVFDDFGRMSAKMGLEVPFSNAAISTFALQNFVDPPTELLAAGGTQIWKITHNGVDTHPIHFHLFDVQVINRVGWDGFIRLPDPNELGWKDTVRIAPLEDTIVALRPVTPVSPFPLPDSIRPLNPMMPIGSTEGFSQINPLTGGAMTTPQTNSIYNFGWEYVWHCHILSHEENDMMRPIVFRVAPEAPTNLTAVVTGSVTLAWTDNSASETGFNLQRADDPAFSVNLLETALPPSTPPSAVGGTLTYFDAAGLAIHYYRIQAVSANGVSAWSNVAQATAAPFMTVAPASLIFAPTALLTPSLPQTVTVSNNGTAPADITGIAIAGANPGDFAQAGTCVIGAPGLAAGASCTINVTFTPAAMGPRGASLVISTTDLLNPTLTVALSGTGAAPVASVTPTSLLFANQLVNTTSAPQSVTLSNTGLSPLTITGITLGGINPLDFARTTTCGATLAAAASCTISVTFTPTVAGLLGATLDIASNDPVNPLLSVTLAGTGIAPVAAVTPASLAFGNQPVNTVSPGQAVILSNTGLAPLAIASIGITGANPLDFTQTNTCGTSLLPGAFCPIVVAFTPGAAGPLAASLTIASSDPVNPTLAVTLTGTGVAAVIAATPAALTFAAQVVGTTSPPQTVTVTNNGLATLALTGILVSGANPGDFAWTSTCGASLAPAASCTVGVTFAPAAIGPRSAALTITSNDPVNPSLAVGLSGSGAGPVAQVAPASLTFAARAVNTTSPPQTATLSNTGLAPLSITAISVIGANAGDFAQTNTCGASLAAGASCSMSVTFTPLALGTRSASLVIASNDPVNPALTVGLTGSGIGPVAALSNGAFNFASQQLNTTSAPLTATLFNFGTAPLLVNAIGITGANPGDFAQTNTCGASLAVGASCSIATTFTPTVAGARTAAVTISSNDPVNPTLTILLNGIGTVALAPVAALTNGAFNFGTQILYTTSTTLTTTLYNLGTAPLALNGIGITGPNATDFAQTNTCGASLAVYASCTIGTSFTPTAAGARTASVVISSNDPVNPTLSLALSGIGSAVLAPQAQMSPLSLAFASQMVNTLSPAQAVVLSNTGTAQLSIAGITLGGANPSGFTQSNTCGTGLAPGSSCAIVVSFAPTVAAAYSASLTVSTNDPANPTLSASLSGTGVSRPAAPSSLVARTANSILGINLTWVDNSTNETGFTLQRALDQAFTIGLASFTLGANATSYTDAAVALNTLYYYRIRAFVSGGASPWSNIAEVTTPAALVPAGPTNLAVTGTTNQSVSLSWTDNSTNETGFRVQRSPSGLAGTWATVATLGVNATSYTNTGLTPATTYWYRVRAYNANGPSTPSNTVSATTLARRVARKD